MHRADRAARRWPIAASSRPTSTAITQGLAQRWRVHLSHRLQVRLYELATLRRPDGRHHVRRAAAGLGVDLALAAVLRRTDRPLFWLRVPLDVIDAAVWGRDIPSPPETPPLIGVPLALEAGARVGWGGLAVPAATWLGLAANRRRSGRPTPLQSVGWQILAVGASWLLDRYELVQRRITDERAATEAEARRSSAFLAGQNEVAMGADSVVDELGRVEHVLATLSVGRPGEGTGRALATWKAGLAEAILVDTVYLGTFLARWERAHRQPDLTADVVIDLPAGDGTTILTSPQAAWLADALDTLQPRGRVVMSVVEGDRRVSGDPLELRIGHRTLLVPGVTEGPPRTVDPRPIALVAGFWWAMSSMTRSHGYVRPRHAFPVACLSLGLAWWAHQSLDRQQANEHQVLLVALVVAGIQGVAITACQRELFNSDGLRHLPVQLNALAPAMFAATYGHRVTMSERAQLGIVGTAIVAASLVVAERPLPARDVALALTWPVAAYQALGRVQAGIERANQAREQELAQLSRWEVEQAWLAGRQSVIDLVTTSSAAARRRLAEGCDGEHPWVDEPLAEELSRRLDLAEGQLDALRWHGPT